MKWLVVALFIVFPLSISAQCFGPGGCQPGLSYGPAKLCIETVCVPIEYTIWDRFVIAKAPLAVNGYQQLGWSGPCHEADVLLWPGAWNQAAQDLEINLLRVHRALK